jgi:NhaP-type Na+/H+ or K+/H+ antiporter
MYQNLAILAAFVLVYSAVAGRIEKTPISGAIVAMGFGLVCGPLGLRIFTPHVDGELLRTLAELTLALVLFTDAANANLSVLKISLQLPERLLLIGLPLTILLGFGIGILVFPGMGLFELAVLATMLAPTDAALGKAVVTNPAVPAALREGLNVESGLNDGICVPSRMIEGLIVNGCCCIKYVHLPSQSESLIAKGAT